MIQFFARVVELREEKSVKCDGKITMDFPSREFLEVTNNLRFNLFDKVAVEICALFPFGLACGKIGGSNTKLEIGGR